MPFATRRVTFLLTTAVIPEQLWRFINFLRNQHSEGPSPDQAPENSNINNVSAKNDIFFPTLFHQLSTCTLFYRLSIEEPIYSTTPVTKYSNYNAVCNPVLLYHTYGIHLTLLTQQILTLSLITIKLAFP